MRHLLNTLYVLTPENFLSLDNDNVVVKNGSNELARFPLHTLESIFCFTYNGLNSCAMWLSKTFSALYSSFVVSTNLERGFG